MAFLLGALLGAGLVATVRRGAGAVNAGPVSSNASASEPQAVVLPASCRQALDEAKKAVTTAQEAVDALRHLQTARLQRLLDDLQETRRQADLLTDRCHRATRTVG